MEGGALIHPPGQVREQFYLLAFLGQQVECAPRFHAGVEEEREFQAQRGDLFL